MLTDIFGYSDLINTVRSMGCNGKASARFPVSTQVPDTLPADSVEPSMEIESVRLNSLTMQSVVDRSLCRHAVKTIDCSPG